MIHLARAQSALEQTIRQHAARQPKEVWLKWKDGGYSYADVLSNTQRAANGLAALGVKPGERVAIMMGNRPEFLWVHFGINFIGAHSVPINTSQRGATLQHILANSDSVAVVFENTLRDAVLSVKDKVPTLRATVVADGPAGKGVDWTLDQLLSHPDREPDIEVKEPSAAVGMMYTSGTTGPPKGVVATGYDMSPLAIMFQAISVKPGETMYTPLPLFHGNALLISAIGSITIGAKLALAEKFSASRFWDDCRKYDAVEFNTLGAMIPILMKQPPKPNDRDNPVRVVLSAACPANVWREFEQRFDVRLIEFYGMVDSPGFLMNDGGKVGAMGKPMGGVEFRVVDDHDQPLPPGKIGELVFRHPRGPLTLYYKLPEATAEAYRGGWFHSGDLAEYDEEGFYYFRGRKKASMRRRGENISAWEIESVLNEHPSVLESAAYAVPSDLGEDEVMVAVVLRPGESLSPEALLDFCQGRMAHYAIPRYVDFVEEIPKTGTHRVQYGVLRERGITETAWDREKAGYQVKK
ncbi:MAG TPA: AMP-binding protein [Candidatus Binatia bacterium]|nr:AMP-binding protein [Candidatus Binatia bacterium]